MKEQQKRKLSQKEKNHMHALFAAEPPLESPPAFPLVALEMLASLLDFLPDALLMIDVTGAIVLLNRQTEELFGYRREELLNRPLETLVPERLRASHTAHRLNYMSTPRARPMGVGLDLLGQRKDGSEFPVDISLRPILVQKTLYIVGAVRDMTAQRLLEQESRAETKARLDVLQLILDRLPTGIFLVHGPQARLLLANCAATDLWGAQWQQGLPMQDFLLQQHIRIFTEDGRPLLPEQSTIGRIMASDKPIFHAQLVLRRSDSVNLPVVVDAIPLDLLQHSHRLPAEMAKTLAFSERVLLVVHQDVTALKEAEALKEQFMSLAAHELRTPVTVLAGYTDLFLRHATKGKGPELDAHLQAMKEATHHLAKLTGDVLDAMRVQAGNFQLQPSSTDLIALIRRVIDQLQTTTDRHRLSFLTTLSHLQISVDAFRIEQVLSNLLTNAIKYSPQGGSIEIAIGRDEQKSEVQVSVRDHGMGIPREQQASIFGRFMRADNARAARITGTGLGLYLCRELVERHGGHIWFESEEHLGSTFFFTLPCEISGPDEQIS